jgi:hypothetical protein
MITELKTATCCEDGTGYIRWAEATNEPEGPPDTGWAMPVGAIEEAYNEVLVNVRFCPFCGKKLET